MEKPLYIFDLDGTLALIEHRQHFIAGKPRRWREFFAACGDDAPNIPVLTVFNHLREVADVKIFSGRSAEVRKQTVAWLAQHTELAPDEIESRLIMRRSRDFTPDDDLKRQWLNEMPEGDRRRLVAVFDDRDRIVAMWRAEGVACFQVAPGNF